MSNPPPPPPPGWQQPQSSGGPGDWQQQPPGWQQPQGAWQQPPQQIVVKQGPGCLKVGLIVAAVLVGFGVLGVACLAFAGNEVADEIDKELDRSMGEANPADYEISDVECVVDGTLGLEATGKIKNLSNEAQGFEINVRWEMPNGDLVTEDPTFTDTIAVGQTQAWRVGALTEAPEGATPTCEVSAVNYTIFDNQEN